MKKLIVKAGDCPAVIGARAIILCDETGEMLPLLYACELKFEAGAAPIVTVSFRIDGENVRLEL